MERKSLHLKMSEPENSVRFDNAYYEYHEDLPNIGGARKRENNRMCYILISEFFVMLGELCRASINVVAEATMAPRALLHAIQSNE